MPTRLRPLHGPLLFFCAAALAACAAPRPRAVVVRHAEAWKNVPPDQDRGPSTEDALTPNGRAQAARLARSLALDLGRGQRVVVHTSPTVRTVQTAEILVGVLGGEVVVVDALRPMAEGETTEEVLARAAPFLDAADDDVLPVVVSHGRVTRALVAARLDPLPEGFDPGLGNGEMAVWFRGESAVQFYPRTPTLGRRPTRVWVRPGPGDGSTR